jgi:hypothetical protein
MAKYINLGAVLVGLANARVKVQIAVELATNNIEPTTARDKSAYVAVLQLLEDTMIVLDAIGDMFAGDDDREGDNDEQDREGPQTFPN